MTNLSWGSNSTLVNWGTSTTGARLLAMFHDRPTKTAPSIMSRNERTRRRNALATRRRKPSSSKAEPITSSLLNDPLTVAENGSRNRGPPGVIDFTTGMAPNGTLRRSTFISEKMIVPLPGSATAGFSTISFTESDMEGASLLTASCSLLSIFPTTDKYKFLIDWTTPFLFAFLLLVSLLVSTRLSCFSFCFSRRAAMSSTINWYSSRSTTPSPFTS
mmetsp:Transcript_2645/g.4540  ORF Transcript_2645/g.4540 Transcript_2645/m.4540 type:complete len:217 (-) Transcript_2645:17-667(-)